jgi:hypothetical protein
VLHEELADEVLTSRHAWLEEAQLRAVLERQLSGGWQ